VDKNFIKLSATLPEDREHVSITVDGEVVNAIPESPTEDKTLVNSSERISEDAEKIVAGRVPEDEANDRIFGYILKGSTLVAEESEVPTPSTISEKPIVGISSAFSDARSQPDQAPWWLRIPGTSVTPKAKYDAYDAARLHMGFVPKKANEAHFTKDGKPSTSLRRRKTCNVKTA
jgi:hypothetical protein